MQNISELAEEIVENQENIISAVFSGIQKKAVKTFNKVTIKKVIIQNEVKYQFEYFYDKNVEHKNLNNDETKAEMKRVLADIQSGRFVQKFVLDYQAGQPELKATRGLNAEHPIEEVGSRLRAMMPWIGANKLVDKEKN